MTARFEIRETSDYVHSSQGWHEVTITDDLTGHRARAVARTYEEAERAAWQEMKARQEVTALTQTG